MDVEPTLSRSGRIKKARIPFDPSPTQIKYRHQPQDDKLQRSKYPSSMYTGPAIVNSNGSMRRRVCKPVHEMLAYPSEKQSFILVKDSEASGQDIPQNIPSADLNVSPKDKEATICKHTIINMNTESSFIPIDEQITNTSHNAFENNFLIKLNQVPAQAEPATNISLSKEEEIDATSLKSCDLQTLLNAININPPLITGQTQELQIINTSLPSPGEYFSSSDYTTIEVPFPQEHQNKSAIQNKQLPAIEPSINIPKPHSGEQVASEALGTRSFEGTCAICTEIVSLTEKIIVCRDCPTRVHQKCLRAQSTYFSPAEALSWLCDKCQTCHVCKDNPRGKSEEVNIPLYKCFICLSHYHMTCHDPTGKFKPKILPKNRFRCRQCILLDQSLKGKQEQHNTINVSGNRRTSTKRTSTGSTVMPPAVVNTKKKEVIETTSIASNSGKRVSNRIIFNRNVVIQQQECNRHNVATSLNTAGVGRKQSQRISIKKEAKLRLAKEQRQTAYKTKWGAGQINNLSASKVKDFSFIEVYDYFKKIFPGEASFFLNQEIDGRALLLLHREDVLNSGLKIGPAINLFEYIQKLQNSAS